MIRNATVSAYDVLGDVWVHATVTTRWGFADDPQARTRTASVQVRGVGEVEDDKWLQDALIALAEVL